MKTLEEALQIIDRNGGKIDGEICMVLKTGSSSCEGCIIKKEFSREEIHNMCSANGNKDITPIKIRVMRKKKLKKLLDK